MPASDSPLPRLRRDLVFATGPTDHDGSPTYTVQDPVTGRYHRLTWAAATVLRFLRDHMTLAALSRVLRQRTTLRLNDDRLLALCRQAEALELTERLGQVSGNRLHSTAAGRRLNWPTKLLHSYLYLRIPLLQPDRLLARLLPRMQFLASPAALTAYVLALLLGLFLLAGRSAEYMGMLPDFLTPGGALAYALTVTAVKVIHEFAHALTAKACGVHVRSMGIAFILFWPVPYSDVTDAWKLSSRRLRFLISFAGIAAELAIGAMALLGWSLLPPGIWQNVCFLLSSATLVSTLAVNLNPAMRFDGYYMLADAWNIDNLQTRAFALTRWRLRRWLLGLDEPPPESDLPPLRQAGMMLYALYTWTYRIGLYAAIAVVVYLKFTKVLGVILFATEIWLFFVQPALREVRALLAVRERLTLNRRSFASAAVVALVLLYLLLPLPRRLSLPAAFVPVRSQTLYAPEAGRIAACPATQGSAVQPGDLLLQIEMPDLAAALRIAEAETALREADVRQIRLGEVAATHLSEAERALAMSRAEEETLRVRLGSGHVTAAIAGTLVEWDPLLRAGQEVMRNRPLGRIADRSRFALQAYVREDHLGDVQPGAEISVLRLGDRQPLAGRVARIDAVRADALDHVTLASSHGGEIPVVRDERGQLVPTGSYYRVEVELAATPPDLRWGEGASVRLWSRPRSRVADGLRYLYRVLLRESDF